MQAVFCHACRVPALCRRSIVQSLRRVDLVIRMSGPDPSVMRECMSRPVISQLADHAWKCGPRACTCALLHQCAPVQVDLIDRTEGLDHGAIREYVAQLVTTQLGDSGFLLRPDQVLIIPHVVSSCVLWSR